MDVRVGHPLDQPYGRVVRAEREKIDLRWEHVCGHRQAGSGERGALQCHENGGVDLVVAVPLVGGDDDSVCGDGEVTDVDVEQARWVGFEAESSPGSRRITTGANGDEEHALGVIDVIAQHDDHPAVVRCVVGHAWIVGAETGSG